MSDGALTILRGELGAVGLTRLVVDMAREAASGDPFAALGPAWSRRERLSRGQARPAVWLYRALLRRLPQEVALALTTRVVAAEGANFVQKGLGRIDARAFRALGPDRAHAQVERWMAHFFTAIAYVDEVDPDEGVVSFKVSACALARLVRGVGHPELAGAFCAADNLYFAAQSPAITLDRPTTIARGHSECHFRLSLEE